MKTPITPDVAKLREMLLAVEDFINEPPRIYDIEPMEVRDYRHALYRKWEPLGRAILASLSTPTAGERDEALGEALFKLSARLKASGFFDDAENHAVYESVVSAFNASTPPARVAIERAREIAEEWHYNPDTGDDVEDIAQLLIRPDVAALSSTTWQGIEGEQSNG